MTREAAKELLPIITAFAEGKEIEGMVSPGYWGTLVSVDIAFDSLPDHYRIKPEPPPLIERWAVVTKDNHQVVNQWVERSNAERVISNNPRYRLVHLREVREEAK
jgi:hypothetical protein